MKGGRVMKWVIAILLVLLLAGCVNTQTKSSEASNSLPATSISTMELPPYLGLVELEFDYRLNDEAAPFVIWVEDDEGNFIKTIFITNDCLQDIEGTKQRFPHWSAQISAKQKPEDFQELSSAEPKNGRLTYVWDTTNETDRSVQEGTYHMMLEGLVSGKNVFYHAEVPVHLSKEVDGLTATDSQNIYEQSHFTNFYVHYHPFEE